MKKKLLYCALFVIGCCGLNTERASAQITGVTVHDQDSLTLNQCTLPALQGYYLYGSVTGTPPNNDSVTIYVNFGDGSDTTYKVPLYTNYFSSSNSHYYQIAGVFTASVTVTTSNSLTTTTTAPAVVISNSCANLSGDLFVTNNNSCTYNAGTDVQLRYMGITIVNTDVNDSVYAWTDLSGHYSVNLPTGYHYTIKPDYGYQLWYNNGNLAPYCPNTGIATVYLTGSTTDNFSFTCTPPTSVDEAVYGWGHHFKPADTGYIEVEDGNLWWWYNGCANITETVTLTLDSHLTYVSTTYGPAPTSVVGNVVTWNLTNNNWYYYFSQIKVYCNASAVLGDTLCNQAVISSNSYPDPNLSNNTYNICKLVSNSWDPNDKQVAPVGQGPQGYINNGTTLNYFVEFQNTGNAAATNVVVTDTISANLALNTLKVLKSSAPVQVYTLPGNVVKFSFSNINLPDSNTSKEGSKGFVTYMIEPKNNHLAAGTQITNQAYIYFDNNPAVVTAKTLNTIKIPTNVQYLSNGSMKASVYPNPANDEVFVKTDDRSNFSVSMIDMIGRTIESVQSTNGSVTINTQHAPAGMYLVKVKNAAGSEVTTKLNVQH